VNVLMNERANKLVN